MSVQGPSLGLKAGSGYSISLYVSARENVSSPVVRQIHLNANNAQSVGHNLSKRQSGDRHDFRPWGPVVTLETDAGCRAGSAVPGAGTHTCSLHGAGEQRVWVLPPHTLDYTIQLCCSVKATTDETSTNGPCCAPVNSIYRHRGWNSISSPCITQSSSFKASLRSAVL